MRLSGERFNNVAFLKNLRFLTILCENGRVSSPGHSRKEPLFRLQKLVLLPLALVLVFGFTSFVTPPNMGQAQVITPSTYENSVYDQETFRIADQLQCPVCQGQTVAYSNAGLAQQMRILIKKKLEAGEKQEQVLQYFVDRYGQGILTTPPKTGFTLLVWLLPVAGLLVGAGTVGYVLRSWRRRWSPTAKPSSLGPEVSQGQDIEIKSGLPAQPDARPAIYQDQEVPVKSVQLKNYEARVERELRELGVGDFGASSKVTSKPVSLKEPLTRPASGRTGEEGQN